MKVQPAPVLKMVLIFLLVVSNAALVGVMSHPSVAGPTTRSSQTAPASSGASGPSIVGVPGKAPLLRTVDVNTLPSALNSKQSTSSPSGTNLDLACLATTVPIRSPKSPYTSSCSATSALPSTSLPASSLVANGPSSISIVAQFNALNQSKACACVPPDGGVAAGPNNVVEMINSAEGIFTKQGTLTNFFTLNSFYNSSDSLSDPKIMFDTQSGRWFSSILDVNNDSIMIAVSNSSSPVGWNIYRVSAFFFNGSYAIIVPDQPILGTSDDKVVVTGNDYAEYDVCPIGRPCTFYAGDQYWVLSKAEMLAGFTGVDFASFGPSGSPFTSEESVHPVQSLSSTSTMYMVSTGAGDIARSTSTAQLISITGAPPAIVTVNPVISLPVSGISIPPPGVQLGTNSPIDSGDQRVMDAAWFQGKLWFGLDTSCLPQGDSVVRSCIRLTEIDTTSNRVLQDMNFSAKGMYYFYPSLRIDSNSGLDVIFGYSSQTNSTCCYPSLAVTGQGPSDPANSLIQPITIVSGSANDTTGLFINRARYGDYFGAGVDPSDPTLVWVEGEYHNRATGNCFFSDGTPTGNCWSTFIAAIKVKGFSVSPTPAYLNIGTSSSLTSSITLTSLGGFAGTVSLTGSVSPSGPTASLSPMSITLAAGGTGTSTLTVSTKKTTPAGQYAVTVTGTSGSISYTTSVLVTVGADFSITANPMILTVQAGSSASSAINLMSLNSFVGNVSLSATVPTSGPTASFNPSSVILTSGGSAATPLTVSTNNNTPTGSYLVIVTAVSGTFSHSLNILFKVRDFGVSSNPATFTFPTFTAYTATSTIRLVSLDGLSSTISFSDSVAPSGLSLSLSSSSVSLNANSTGKVILTISASASVAPGTYAVTVTGTASIGGSNIAHSTTVSVFIPSPDFSISVTPIYIYINPGSTGTFTTSLASLNKFSGNVSLTYQYAPTGLTLAFNPTIVALKAGATANSTVTASVAISTAPGVYFVSIFGSSNSLSHSVQMEIIIPGFTVSAGPASLTIGQATSATSTVSVQSIAGFSQNVTLSATLSNSTVPNRPTISLSPSVVKPPGYSYATSTLTVTAGSSTPPGSYTVTINATTTFGANQISKIVTVSITVPSPDFALAANPNTFSMLPGSGTSAITVTSLYNFAGTVSLSVSAPGVTASISPSSVTLSAYGTASATLTITGSTLGTFTATVTATGSSIIHNTAVTVGIGGTVCIADIAQVSSSNPCPGGQGWTFDGAGTTPQTQLKVGVFVSGSPGFSLFSVTVLSDSSILTPVSVDLTGTVIGTVALQAVCIRDIGNCNPYDTGNTVSVVAFSYSPSPTPSTGLLFEITYNITNFTITQSSPITFLTSCSGSSFYGTNLCVSVTNGGTTQAEGAVQTATFSNWPLKPFVALSSSPTVLGPVPASTGATATITATSNNGFPNFLDTGTVSFTTTQSSGVNAVLNSSSVTLTPGSSSSITITLVGSAAGTYFATVYGTYTATNTTTGFSSTLVATITVSIIVTDFSVSSSPTSLSFNAGSSGTTVVTLKSLNGFSGTVALSATSFPSGVTVSFNPSSVTLTSGGSANSTATFAATVANTYIATMLGKSGSDTRSVRITVKVAGFKETASPTSLSLTPGSSKNATVTLTSINSFAGTVSLSTSISPSGGRSPTATTNPTSISLTAGGKQNSTLTVSTTSRTAQGFYNVTVTATSGSETTSIIVKVCVGTPTFCAGVASPASATVATPTGLTAISPIITSEPAISSGDPIQASPKDSTRMS